MDVGDKRKELRLALLKDLYEHHFTHKGEPKVIPREPNEDSEHVLAYEYLKDKGLAEFKVYHKSAYQAKITASGIDFVESNNEF
ncbi:hypothetical protein [Effusibacillus consociatus]|uniref:Uncharacterized protein n=1 Tax=Effusibacillus consociatus TaxID=1117041 RepID=A0ABV9Q4I6_9BACL